MSEKSKTENDMFLAGMIGGPLIVGGIFALAGGALLLRGFVASVLWGWFIVPVFNAPPLGYLSALGVMLTVSLCTPKQDSPKDRTLTQTMTAMFLPPLMSLLCGWLVTLAM